MSDNTVDPDPGRPTTTREWVRALLLVAITAGLIVVVGAWIVFTFVLQTCGTQPACG